MPAERKCKVRQCGRANGVLLFALLSCGPLVWACTSRVQAAEQEKPRARATDGGLFSLQSVAFDPAAPMERRLEAVSAMAWLSDEDTSSALRAIALGQDGGTPFPASLRAEAVVSLARRLGKSGVPELQPYLVDPDPAVREGAVRGLAILGGPKAQAALEARIEEEPSAQLRERIEQSLTRMQP